MSTTPVVPETPAISRRRAQTRERLMLAAMRVFAERGIRGASVEEICEEAGFTRGAFYSNFADKDALVLALIRRELDSAYAAAAQAVAEMKLAAARQPGEGTAAELVGVALAAYEQANPHGRDGVLTGHELLLHAAREPAIRGPYVAFAEECLQQVSALIRDAVAHAGLEFTVDVADAIALLTAAHRQVQTDALLSGRADWHTLRVLVLALTRPRGRGRAVGDRRTRREDD